MAKFEMASVKSLLNPGACGFIKAFLYEKSCDKQTYSEMHNSCNKIFDINKNMLVEIEEIRRRLSKLKKCIQKLGKDSPAKKDEFLVLFFKFIVGEITCQRKEKTLCLPLF